MAQTRRPPTRLPQHVYWMRRLMLLLVAAALVVGIGELLGAAGSGGQPASQASTSAHTTTPSPSSTPSTGVAGPVAPVRTKGKTASAVPLLAPSGPCADDAVSVLPSVPKAAAGAPMVLRLSLEGTAPACSFAVSPQSLVVKITSGSDRIWSSQDCPSAVPTSTVVVRSGTPTVVPVSWSGRRSDPTCSTSTDWALPGFYHVYAAALGSTPADVQFEVTLPSRPVITKTAKPTPTPTATPSSKATAKAKTGKASGTSGKGSACGGDNAAGTC